MNLSKTEINILSNAFNYYTKNLCDKSDALNNSHIKAIAKLYKKLNEQKYKMNGWGQLPWQYLSEKLANELSINSQSKILECNLNHDVKIDFKDLADFNRWEKIRTYEKKTI